MPADPFQTRIFVNTKCLAQPFNKAEVLDKISDFPKEVLTEVAQEVPQEVPEVAQEVNILKRETMMTFTTKKIKKEVDAENIADIILAAGKHIQHLFS